MYWLFLFVILIPAIEISIFIWTGSAIGIFSVLLIIVLTGFVGIMLVKQEGAKTWYSIQRSYEQHIPPTDEITDGVCIIIGGIFLLTPGFFTDALGFLLVLPWTRPPFKKLLLFLIIKRISNGKIIYRKW